MTVSDLWPHFKVTIFFEVEHRKVLATVIKFSEPRVSWKYLPKMWKNYSEIETGVGSEPATSKGAAYWLSRPTQMVLAADGATSTTAHSVRVSDMVRFCGHVAGCNCGPLRLQPTMTRATRSVSAYLFIACLLHNVYLYRRRRRRRLSDFKHIAYISRNRP